MKEDPRAREKELRDLVQREAIKGESEHAIEPRRLDQLVSLRLDPKLISGLRVLATKRQTTVSNLLREAASRLLEDPTVYGEFKVTQVMLTSTNGLSPVTGTTGSSTSQTQERTTSALAVTP